MYIAIWLEAVRVLLLDRFGVGGPLGGRVRDVGLARSVLLRVFKGTYALIRTCIYIRMYIYMYIYIDVDIYIYMYVYTNLHT